MCVQFAMLQVSGVFVTALDKSIGLTKLGSVWRLLSALCLTAALQATECSSRIGCLAQVKPLHWSRVIQSQRSAPLQEEA